MSDSTSASGTGGFGEILVSSRSLDEYRAMFALTEQDLRHRILDCPGGAAGFTAEVCARGGDVTACDVAYFGDGLANVAATAVAEAERGNDFVRAHAQDYRWEFFADPDAHRRARCESARQFAAHSSSHPQRYVPGQLPTLPFADNSVDLVLSSHLLFSYADDLDPEFHRRAIVELLRIGTELRVFPLVPIGSCTPYPQLRALISELADDGVDCRVVDVDYEFQVGAGQMLMCRRARDGATRC
ncbi:methyltransferase domain-containing protein [Nocardia sp. GTS18]|uniref:methyltransferase domain-containing protein n=1 Tax=Nocardia sp. GTS18 TaxID=1778064 RepID=UPI0015EFA72A|nr:methyltransferase domain-containing protein [Nocardia sp. GTS18]